MFLLVGMTVPKTVQLNGEARFFTIEIKIVNSFRMLAAEFVTREMTVAQPAPYEFFCPSFLFAKYPSAFDVGHGKKIKETDQK